jgi:hypothetical protein
MGEIPGETFIRFIEDVEVALHTSENGNFEWRTMEKGKIVRCNLMACEVNPHPSLVDMEFDNGDMIYHLPVDSFEICTEITGVLQ